MMWGDSSVQAEFFDLELYRKACAKLGKLTMEQCYIFEPIPALGGSKTLDSLSVGSSLPYLAILLSA